MNPWLEAGVLIYVLTSIGILVWFSIEPVRELRRGLTWDGFFEALNEYLKRSFR